VPKPTGAAIPVETRAKTAKTVGSGMHRKNILLVGDAAGQVKSTTGGGVIFGGNCAALAGKYVTKPERYEEEWRAKYGADLTIHKFLHDYLASKPDSSLSRLGKRLNRLNIGEYLSKSGHMDKPTKMVELGLLAHIMKNLV
jgi:flavin-dependent dehydrogenase